MTTMEYRVVTVSGEVHRVTVVWSDAPTLVAMAEALRRGLLVREIVPPGEMTRDEALAAARGGSDEVAATLTDLRDDLLRRAAVHDALADVYATKERAAVDHARAIGKADAYRHAAELCMATKGGV